MSSGEWRCWRLAHDVALAAGRSEAEARRYADECLAAYRDEAAQPIRYGEWRA